MENENFKHQNEALNNILNECKVKLEVIAVNEETAKTKSSDINAFHSRIQEIQKQSEQNRSSIETYVQEAQGFKKQLDDILSLSNTSKIQFDQILKDCQEKLSAVSAIADNSKLKEQELNTFHTRIIELKASSESNQAAIADITTQAQSLKKQIDDLFSNISNSNRDINQLLQDSTTKSGEITSYYTAFKELRIKIDNPETGLGATLNKSVDILAQINKTSDASVKAKEEIQFNKVKSDSLLQETDVAKQKVDNNLNTSIHLKEEIGKILDLVRDTGLANSFDKRRKRSQISAALALVLIGVGVALSAFLVNKVFFAEGSDQVFQNISNDYIKFLMRLTLTAPGVFLTWFGALQYTKERHFLEQYEFKTAAALALENYTKLLKQNYNTKQNEIFELNLELIRSVYKEPEYSRKIRNISAKLKIPATSTSAEINSKPQE